MLYVDIVFAIKETTVAIVVVAVLRLSCSASPAPHNVMFIDRDGWGGSSDNNSGTEQLLQHWNLLFSRKRSRNPVSDGEFRNAHSLLGHLPPSSRR